LAGFVIVTRSSVLRAGVVVADRLRAVAAGQLRVGRPAARLVDQADRRLVDLVPVAPPHQREQHGVQVDALLCEAVLVALRAHLVGLAREDPLLDEQAQAVRQEVAPQAEAPLEVVEARRAAEGLAQDQDRPALPDDRPRSSDGAVHLAQRIVLHAPEGT
jgi:hypothetical protein